MNKFALFENIEAPVNIIKNSIVPNSANKKQYKLIRLYARLYSLVYSSLAVSEFDLIPAAIK